MRRFTSDGLKTSNSTEKIMWIQISRWLWSRCELLWLSCADMSRIIGRRWRPFERSKRASIEGDVDRLHGGRDTEDVDEWSGGGQLLWRSVAAVDVEADRAPAERGGGRGRVAPLLGRSVGRRGSVVAASRARRQPATCQQRVPSTTGDF